MYRSRKELERKDITAILMSVLSIDLVWYRFSMVGGELTLTPKMTSIFQL